MTSTAPDSGRGSFNVTDRVPAGASLQNQEVVPIMQWWGYSKEHGWVVLDRNVPRNAPGLKTDLLFLRCDDTTTFDVPREKWLPPFYRFAPNHIRELAPDAANAATGELEGLKRRWPEFEREIQRVQREAEMKVQAVRAQEEAAKKQAASEKRKAAAAART